MTRRRLLAAAAAAPVAAPLVLSGCGSDLSDDALLGALEQMNTLVDHPLSSGRLRTILPAVRHNRAFFQAVRDLDFDDATDLGVMFVAHDLRTREPNR